MRVSGERGFTLIELMIAMVIIGILAAVAIPALLNALDRGRQKRTMADLHTIGTAVHSYAVDNNLVPNATTMAALATAVEPDYISSLPRNDGWGNPILYTGVGIDYTIGSTAKGGGTTLTVVGGGGATSRYEDDIIFVNGQFLQFPDGMQE